MIIKLYNQWREQNTFSRRMVMPNKIGHENSGKPF